MNLQEEQKHSNPHVAGNLMSPLTLDKNVEMFVEDLDNYINGRPLKNLVDRRKGY